LLFLDPAEHFMPSLDIRLHQSWHATQYRRLPSCGEMAMAMPLWHHTLLPMRRQAFHVKVANVGFVQA
jgi:hypothetical protein